MALSMSSCDSNELSAEKTERHYAREVLVLGIGNILWADEGFGPRCAQAFADAFDDVPGVDVMDGGTLGGYLINEITSSRRILVFDCCDFHDKPGTMRVLTGDDIALWSATKISPHQTGFNDLLATAALLGLSPEAVAVVGAQPEILDDYGGSLSATLHPLVDKAVQMGREALEAWGYALRPRATDAAKPVLADQVLSMARYEAERPSADAACRVGDERFLKRMTPDALVGRPEDDLA